MCVKKIVAGLAGHNFHCSLFQQFLDLRSSKETAQRISTHLV